MPTCQPINASRAQQLSRTYSCLVFGKANVCCIDRIPELNWPKKARKNVFLHTWHEQIKPQYEMENENIREPSLSINLNKKQTATFEEGKNKPKITQILYLNIFCRLQWWYGLPAKGKFSVHYRAPRTISINRILSVCIRSLYLRDVIKQSIQSLLPNRTTCAMHTCHASAILYQRTQVRSRCAFVPVRCLCVSAHDNDEGEIECRIFAWKMCCLASK